MTALFFLLVGLALVYANFTSPLKPLTGTVTVIAFLAAIYNLFCGGYFGGQAALNIAWYWGVFSVVCCGISKFINK